MTHISIKERWGRIELISKWGEKVTWFDSHRKKNERKGINKSKKSYKNMHKTGIYSFSMNISIKASTVFISICQQIWKDHWKHCVYYTIFWPLISSLFRSNVYILSAWKTISLFQHNLQEIPELGRPTCIWHKKDGIFWRTIVLTSNRY